MVGLRRVCNHGKPECQVADSHCLRFGRKAQDNAGSAAGSVPWMRGWLQCLAWCYCWSSGFGDEPYGFPNAAGASFVFDSDDDGLLGFAPVDDIVDWDSEWRGPVIAVAKQVFAG